RLRRSPDLVLTQVGLDELDRDAAVLDDGDTESLERAVRPEEYLLAFDRRVEVVHLEGHVGHRPEQRVERAAVLEAVVLDAEPGRVLSARRAHLEHRAVLLPGAGHRRRHTHVVMTLLTVRPSKVSAVAVSALAWLTQ